MCMCVCAVSFSYIYSSVGQVYSFLILAIVNNAAMNTGKYMSFYITFFFCLFVSSNMPRNRIAGTYNPPAIQETQPPSLNQEELLEKEMANHSSILTYKIPQTEEYSPAIVHGVQRVGHD